MQNFSFTQDKCIKEKKKKEVAVVQSFCAVEKLLKTETHAFQ